MKYPVDVVSTHQATGMSKNYTYIYIHIYNIYIYSNSVHAGFSCSNDVEWTPSNFVSVGVSQFEPPGIPGELVSLPRPASTSISRLCQELTIKEFECSTQGPGWWWSVAAALHPVPAMSFLPDVKKIQQGPRVEEGQPAILQGIAGIAPTSPWRDPRDWGCWGQGGQEGHRKKWQEISEPLRRFIVYDCFLKTPYESEDHRAADIAMFLLAGHRQVASLHFASIVWCKLQNAWQKLRMKSIVCLGMPESPARLCSKTSATPWPASQNPCLCGRWSQKAVPGAPDSTRQPDQSPTLPCSDQRLGVPIVRLPHRRGGWTIARRLKISERSGPVLVEPLRSRSFHSVVICFVTLLWGLHDRWVWKNEP